MAVFGKTSMAVLDTCHPEIQMVLVHALKTVSALNLDFTLVYGHRGKQDQDDIFLKGMSKLKYPNSKHNSMPSNAVDVAPWVKDRDHPNGYIPWSDFRYWYLLAGIILTSSIACGIKLRWGGDWDRDGDMSKKDNPFNDLGHFERG